MREAPVDDGPDVTWKRIRYSRIFHGVLIRTLQTAYAFARGLGYSPELMPVVAEIGDQAWANEIVTNDFKAAVKTGKGNFDALSFAHRIEKIREWGDRAALGVRKMFLQMNDGEIAVAFGHSPMIELAAFTVLGGLPDEFNGLKDLEGLVFEMDEDETIRVTGSIRVQPEAASTT